MMTSEHHPDDPAPLDPEVAATIDGMGPVPAGRIWKATIEELPRLAERIASAIGRADLHELERASHAGKGSCGTVGLTELSFGMARLNAAARAGDLATAQHLWKSVRPVLELSTAAVAAHSRRD